jgi:hypothetical protein
MAVLALLCGCARAGAETQPAVPSATLVIQPSDAAAAAADAEHLCDVGLARFRLVAEATAHAADEASAHRQACQQACEKLGKPCVELDGILIRPFSLPRESQLGSAGHSTRCEVSKREKVLERARSSVSVPAACAAAYRTACPPPCEDAAVYEVDGMDRARVDALAAEAHAGEPVQPAAAAASDRSCELVATVVEREATAKGDSRQGQSVDALREQTRAEACERLAVDAATCADPGRAHVSRTSTKLSIQSGVSSSAVEITLALLRRIERTGRGVDKEAACRHAVQQLCAAGACVAGKPALSELDGVPLHVMTPKHSLFD